MFRTTKQVMLFSGLMVSAASAQTNLAPNIFFGFDFVLQPIAIKWACGGSRDQDLAAFEKLIAAFPEDAKRAGLRTHIDAMLQISEGEESLIEVLGGKIAKEQAEKLCNAARPISVTWATPEQLANDDEDGMTPDQRAAWAEFWQVIEGLQ
ncbi:hypothetical protein [Epibacterium sp. Ofav1-8]|uniref:hypothetical protein n=1 Tax=Epibacterium sp. Ofav1-8 TaxID=2917735 RepID=UPI001EF5A7E3|nr:hypothetical protein [Epibacterium sp. Ofav1-8]MCG7624161.1 hypothetical protein [Epibacterium sp. Ofav1-8]